MLPEIGPEELDVVNLFLRMSTQWDRAGMAGVRTGLNYGRVPAIAALAGIATGPALLDDLRLMEAEALIRMAAA